ncbi:Dedicator of cytokinesis protein 4 [Liparis tanakae]|uniref:Dedicator of cytokinesis protein 4 n=1 Tax=Liparis tanakae TaxID=230148 RepID=A0A4Z2HKA7_9TELE|nr:Dedicator of cytokinesis protein 4 [Liparis tanakae]
MKVGLSGERTDGGGVSRREDGMNRWMGGDIKVRVKAFFVKDYIMNHPEDGEKIGRLRELMFEQAHILEYGLAVHEKFVPQDMRPLHKKLVDQFHLMKSSLGIQEFPAYVRASPVHFTNGSPRTCSRNSVPNIISPDGGRGVARRSLPSYPAVNRYSSSSLSSQASNEPSPSTSSLSSNHSASPNVTSSAPSSARGSPQMAEKHKHSRENTCLSPRDRPRRMRKRRLKIKREEGRIRPLPRDSHTFSARFERDL